MTIKRANGGDQDFGRLVGLSDAFYRQTFEAAMDYYDPILSWIRLLCLKYIC